jgi:hypothetical protein
MDEYHKEEGVYRRKIKGILHKYKYDAILPESVRKNFPLIYPGILTDLLKH